MDAKNSGFFRSCEPGVHSLQLMLNTTQGASLCATAKFLQLFSIFDACPPSLVVATPCAPHRCCQTDGIPVRDWLGSDFRAGSPGFFQKKRPRGYYLPEPPLDGCSFVKSCFMVTDQKPVVESGVQNLSMAHGALTVPGSSYSMTPVSVLWSVPGRLDCAQPKLQGGYGHA